MRDKAFNIAKNPKYDGYQRGLAWMVYKFFDKKTSCGGIKNEIMLKKRISTSNRMVSSAINNKFGEG